MMQKKSILIDFLLISCLIIMTVTLLINKNQISKAQGNIIQINDSLLQYRNFKTEVLNSFIPEDFIESVNLNGLKLKDKNGQEIVLDSLINNETKLVLAFNNECLSCLDKHLSTLEETIEGIVICGFKTYRQFLAFDNPFLSSAKAYYLNDSDYHQYIGLHDGVLAFIYQKESGSGLAFLHKYEISELTNRYLSIVNDYLNNNSFTSSE